MELQSKDHFSPNSGNGPKICYRVSLGKHTGIVRSLDELGRIVLLKELRTILRIANRDPVEFFVNVLTKSIIIQKYRTKACLFCQSSNQIHFFRERYVCSSCLRDLKEGWQSSARLVELESAASVQFSE